MTDLVVVNQTLEDWRPGNHSGRWINKGEVLYIYKGPWVPKEKSSIAVSEYGPLSFPYFQIPRNSVTSWEDT